MKKILAMILIISIDWYKTTSSRAHHILFLMIIKVFLLSPIELKFEPHSNKIIFRNEKKSGQQKKTF